MGGGCGRMYKGSGITYVTATAYIIICALLVGGIWGETSNRCSLTMPCKVVISFNIHITEALSTGIHISCPPGGSLLFSLCIGRSKAPHSCITKMDLFNNNINSTNNKNQSKLWRLWNVPCKNSLVMLDTRRDNLFSTLMCKSWDRQWQ